MQYTSGQDRFPSAPIILACLLGCVLPAIAYAQAMGALFGFIPAYRKWVWLLLGVPTIVWLVASPHQHLRNAALTLMLLGAQLLIAVVVAAVIRRFTRRANCA